MFLFLGFDLCVNVYVVCVSVCSVFPEISTVPGVTSSWKTIPAYQGFKLGSSHLHSMYSYPIYRPLSLRDFLFNILCVFVLRQGLMCTWWISILLSTAGIRSLCYHVWFKGCWHQIQGFVQTRQTLHQLTSTPRALLRAHINIIID